MLTMHCQRELSLQIPNVDVKWQQSICVEGPATSSLLLGQVGINLTKPIWMERSHLAPSVTKDTFGADYVFNY